MADAYSVVKRWICQDLCEWCGRDGSDYWYLPWVGSITGLRLVGEFRCRLSQPTFDEATFSTVGRSADWLLASYNNQKTEQSSNPYLNFESLVGPISLDDEDYTGIYGKKGTAINEFLVAHSGSGSFLCFRSIRNWLKYRPGNRSNYWDSIAIWFHKYNHHCNWNDSRRWHSNSDKGIYNTDQ